MRKNFDQRSNLSALVHLQARAMVAIHHFGLAAAPRHGLHHPDPLQPLPSVGSARKQPLGKGAAGLEVPRVELNLLQDSPNDTIHLACTALCTDLGKLPLAPVKTTGIARGCSM
jgi:hypothetical protein